jgi:hypothetical protein
MGIIPEFLAHPAGRKIKVNGKINCLIADYPERAGLPDRSVCRWDSSWPITLARPRYTILHCYGLYEGTNPF